MLETRTAYSIVKEERRRSRKSKIILSIVVVLLSIVTIFEFIVIKRYQEVLGDIEQYYEIVTDYYGIYDIEGYDEYTSLN